MSNQTYEINTPKEIETNQKQSDSICQSYGRWNIWEGSVRSGKTFASLIRWLKFVLECPDDDLIVVGRTSVTIYENIVKFYEEYFPAITSYQRGNQILTLGTKKIRCVGANDEKAYTKIAGNTRSGAYVDEISLIPWSFMQVLDQRLSKPHSKLFGTTNPDSPFHPLKTMIDEADQDEVRVFKFMLEDNNHLSPSYISNLKKTHTGLFYKRYILAEWTIAEGAIYDFFDDSLHVCDIPPSYAKYYIAGIDYGTSNSFACLLIGYNDDYPTKIWVEKEYTWDSKKEMRSKTDYEYADDIAFFLKDYPVRMVYVDPSALSFITELRKRKVRVKQANNDVEDGIRRVATLLASGDLKICKAAKNTIKEMYSYVWCDKASAQGKDKPLKKMDHHLDALRYGVFTRWSKGDLKTQSADERAFEQYKRQHARNPMAQTGWGSGWQNVGGNRF